jgi:hypothetical protein
MTNKILKLLGIMMISSLVWSSFAFASETKTSYPIAPGMTYKQINTFETGTLTQNQAINMLEMDLTNAFTSVGLSTPKTLTSIEKTTSHALRQENKDRWVMGAINGGFFFNNQPMNLLSVNNRLVHMGEVFDDRDKYVNQPLAFGVSQSGQAVIDAYDVSMTYTYRGQTYPIELTNQKKYDNLTTLYTSDYSKPALDTHYTTDIVVQTTNKPTLEFGQSIEGTIIDVKPTLEDRHVSIPPNGFVISASGSARDRLKSAEVGDQITLSVDINDAFKQSQFIIASGPLLVKDNKVSLSMNQNSLNARIRAPRTAVAIDEAGTQVQFITVDGRQSGYSRGMTLLEFSQFLKDQGVDRAINLDGGGSTTFAMRRPGDNLLNIINRPSDGRERAVSSALLAFSTAPPASFQDVLYGHWSFHDVNSLVNREIVSGYPDKTFRPDEKIERGHSTIMLSKHLGLPLAPTVNPGFTDVKEQDKNYAYISAVANAGIILGKGDKTFDQYAPLTRAELAIILKKAYGVEEGEDIYFSDVPKTHWAFKAISGLYEANLTSGYSDGTFRPNQPVTRAEFAAFVNRFN